MHLSYVQTGKLKQKRRCETPRNESESELEASCLIAKLYKHRNSKDEYHHTSNSPLPHPISAKGLYWEKLPKYPVLATGATMCHKGRLPTTLKSFGAFFVTLEWEDSRPLHPHILVNPPPIFRMFIASLYYLWILPVSKYESVLNLTELLLSFWFQRYLVAASSIC